jgi:hypothetical protein
MGSGTQFPARYIHQCSPKTLNAELQVINKQYRLPDQHPYRLWILKAPGSSLSHYLWLFWFK